MYKNEDDITYDLCIDCDNCEYIIECKGHESNI